MELTVALDLRKVDIGSLDAGHVGTANIKHEIRQRGVAVNGDTTGLRVVLRRGDLAVVALDDGGVGDDEGGAGVGDGLAGGVARLRLAGADGELGGRELPEALGGVDGDPGHGAVELGGVDVAELVRARGGLAQVGGEHGLRERGHDVVEEGLLLLGLDRVELAEGETDQTVVVAVLDEGLRHRGGHLDGLRGRGGTADVDRVGAHVAGRAGAVTVRDGPGGALDHLERRGLRRVVQGVAGLRVGGELRVEDPQVRRAGVEVQVERLPTDVDGGQVLDIAGLGGGDDEARAGGCRCADIGGVRGGVGSERDRLGDVGVGELVLGGRVLDGVHQCRGDVHAVLAQRLEQLPGTVVALEVDVSYPLDLEHASLLDVARVGRRRRRRGG